jgi:hypothetical protein
MEERLDISEPVAYDSPQPYVEALYEFARMFLLTHLPDNGAFVEMVGVTDARLQQFKKHRLPDFQYRLTERCISDLNILRGYLNEFRNQDKLSFEDVTDLAKAYRGFVDSMTS